MFWRSYGLNLYDEWGEKMSTNRENVKNSGKRRLLPVLLTILMAVVLSFSVVSCGNDDEKASDGENSSVAVTEKETTEDTKEKKDTTEEESDKAGTETKQTETRQLQKNTAAADNGTAKKSTKAKATTKATKSASKGTTAASACYISVEGYCSNKKVTLQSGDTVYDILKRSGASVSARNSGYGVYVEGINGRFEFDEGPTSGWMYSVNGSTPNVSCSSYTVGKGDQISWYYVTDY